MFPPPAPAERAARAGLAPPIFWAAALWVAAGAAALLLGMRASSAETPVARPMLFNTEETAYRDAGAFPKWSGMLARYAAEAPARDIQACQGRDCAPRRWRAFVQGLAGQDPIRQLDAVQAYVNRVPYRSDRAAHGASDYWATPGEFLTRGGDCEDYAIAKFLSLRMLGWPAEDLRIVIVEDAKQDRLHAVLVAYRGGKAYVLDNLRAGIAEQGAIAEYRPVYSITEHAWFYHGTGAPAAAHGAAAHSAVAEAR